MSSATDFETYARDCVKLAEQPDAPPELREQLLQMACEWMQVMMEAGDGTCRSIEPAGRLGQGPNARADGSGLPSRGSGPAPRLD